MKDMKIHVVNEYSKKMIIKIETISHKKYI